jgi:hypothetical protein
MLPSSRDALRGLVAAIIVAAAVMAPPAAAQRVTVERESALHAEARLEAPVTATVAQGATGEVIGKSGPWLNVKTSGATGWLFSFNVRFNSAAGAAGESGAGSALGRLVGPKRDINVTATIGIRGLDEEDLREARFDASQMKLLDHYAASAEDAEAHARDAGLAAAKVDYFEGEAQ